MKILSCHWRSSGSGTLQFKIHRVAHSIAKFCFKCDVESDFFLAIFKLVIQIKLIRFVFFFWLLLYLLCLVLMKPFLFNKKNKKQYQGLLSILEAAI